MIDLGLFHSVWATGSLVAVKAIRLWQTELCLELLLEHGYDLLGEQ